MLISNKNKVKLQLLGMFIFALFLVGCDPSSKDKMDFYNSTKSIDLSNENIKSISINSSENKVKDVFGKPNFIDKIENPKSSYYVYGKNDKNYDLDFRLINGKVKRYLILSSKYAMSKGITVGNSKADLIKAYGDNFYERTDTGANIIGYFDKVNKINIEFGLSNNKINGITVSEIN